MRLTLRTLLAFLDHTLSEEDEKTLAEKVETSTIATELAQRIRAVTANPLLDSAPPEAVGPTDDANAIAEYLDDTLAPELTADVERRCVSSNVQLSEVAACHQILAIVLGEPAEVPQSLRRKIYEIGKASGAAAATPDSTDRGTNPSDVTPVGPEDSGVAEATTRLAAEPDLNETLSAAAKAIRNKMKNEPSVDPQGRAMAGDRSRERLESIGPLLSGGRPSRVTPVLVALALAAAFFFVVTQAFGPLLEYNREQNTSSQQADATGASDEDTLDPSTTPASADSTPSNDPSAGSNAAQANEPPNAANTRAAEDIADVTSAEPNDSSAAETETADGSTTTTEPAAEGPRTFGTPPAGEPGSETSRTGEDRSADATSPPATGPTQTGPTQTGPTQTGPTQTGPTQTGDDDNNPLDRAVAAAKQAPPLGVVELDGGLLMRQDAETGEWNRVVAQTEVVAGDVLACSPTYNARLLLADGLEVTLFGPTALRVSKMDSRPGSSPRLALTMDFGRITLTATNAPVQLAIATPASSGRCTLASTGAVAAISVAFRRAPGSDLLDPASSIAVMDLLAVQSRTEWTVAGKEASPISLSTGQACRFQPSQTPQIDLDAAPPQWTLPGAERVSSSLAKIHEGLAEFWEQDLPLELALRSAINFRDPEVSALAARTLIHLGMLDVLFGPEGVLNKPAHRNQWPVLVGDLRAFINRGPAAAQIAGAAIGTLEGEESGGKIWALLIGFSSEQIARGADAAILELMDDESMVVRVIATETLRHVTGATNDYRADYESTTRRSQAIKELQRGLRRDQIRWADPEAGTQGLPTIDGLDQLP